MQPLDGSESLVIDCSVTLAWYFKDVAKWLTEENRNYDHSFTRRRGKLDHCRRR